MQKHKPLTIALDCDDVLMSCIELAMEMQNKALKFDPPMVLEEITKWSPAGVRSDCILECFKKPSFFKKQRPYPGAQEFVRKLCEKADVYIMTAVPVCAMGIRAEMIKKYFPEIQDDHIILTKSKNLVNIDVLLDDAPHNILATTAKFPVVMRRPWNMDLSNTLAVTNYEEFLVLIDVILNRYEKPDIDTENPVIVGLVGMSGSGKSAIAQELVKTGKFEQPRSFTDRPRREENEIYNFVTTQEFKDMCKSGEIFESTVYSGYNYGSSASAIEDIIKRGKSVVIPIDICGAVGLKTRFENVATVFVDRNKRTLVETIINRNCSNEDKTNRILYMDAEIKNADICDYVLNNDGELDDSVQELLSMFDM